MSKLKYVWLLGFMLLAGVQEGQAQDLKSILSGIAGSVSDKVSEKRSSLEGTWMYVGPDCKFKSENFLATAGGEVAARKVEEQMTGIMEKLGFKEGASYTFNADSTYTSVINGRTTKGTYSYNANTKELTMKTRLGVKLKTTVSKGLSADKMSLLFQADKLMSLIQVVGGAISKASSSSAVSTANALLKEYDGLMLGFELQKQK